MLPSLRGSAGAMCMWGRIGAGWDRLAGIQRGQFVGPPEPTFFTVQFPWALRARLWLGVRLVRSAKWVLGDLVPDPFDEEGPHFVAPSVVEIDGDEDA